MRPEFLSFFVCPQTGDPLRLENAVSEGGHVMEGELVNSADPSRRYPIVGGVPRFVAFEGLEAEQRQTVETFSFKWQQIPNYTADEDSKSYREGWYYERFGFVRGDADVQAFLDGAENILEAGTATGVDTDMLARNSTGRVFGIDISTAIDTAAKRFWEHPRVALAQADIQALPFALASFDVISCDQVLHHTPNPPENFARLVRLLRPGGKLLLYVYKVKGALREFSDDYLRGLYTQSSVEAALDFSARLTRLGRNLSALGVKVTVEDEFPEFGLPKGEYDVQRLIYDYIFKCYWNPSFDFETNVMVNFDWYRPLHAYRYTPADMQEWASTNGLEIQHLNVSPSGLSVIFQKDS
jgi:SAM-dependent methyltransferase